MNGWIAWGLAAVAIANCIAARAFGAVIPEWVSSALLTAILANWAYGAWKPYNPVYTIVINYKPTARGAKP